MIRSLRSFILAEVEEGGQRNKKGLKLLAMAKRFRHLNEKKCCNWIIR